MLIHFDLKFQSIQSYLGLYTYYGNLYIFHRTLYSYWYSEKNSTLHYYSDLYYYLYYYWELISEHFSHNGGGHSTQPIREANGFANMPNLPLHLQQYGPRAQGVSLPAHGLCRVYDQSHRQSHPHHAVQVSNLSGECTRSAGPRCDNDEDQLDYAGYDMS